MSTICAELPESPKTVYITKAVPKAEQHVRCCCAVGFAHDIAARIPDCVSATPLGARAKLLLPMINEVTRNLHNSNLRPAVWERIRRCFALAAPMTAFHESWEPELQKATWATQVFLADVMWCDATIVSPIWFGYPLRVKQLTRTVRSLLDHLTDELVSIYGEDGPAELGTDLYLQIAALCSKRIR